MKKIKIFLFGIFFLLLPGCNNNTIDFYQDRKTKLDLKKFFNGDIEGWGAIFDWQGRQIRNFSVKIKGTWDQNKGVLHEQFEFNDGEKVERKWDIEFSDENRFVGKAHDIIDRAKGIEKGNAVNINYVLQVPYNKSTINLNMDDWMYLIEENIVLNRTDMKKFGFKVGEIVLFMKKKYDPS
jgi:hypothetical protein